MSAPAGKKAAISSFFSKSKAKKGGAGGGAAAGGSSATDSIISSSDLGVPGVSDSGAWADSAADGEDSAARDLLPSGSALASKLHMGVADLDAAEDDDLGDDDKIRRNLEAQEARRALNSARQHAREKAAANAASAPAAAPTAASSGPLEPMKWRPRSLAEKAAESSGAGSGSSSSGGKEPNIKDERAFPTLGRAMSGLPPGAKLLTQEKGLGALATKNQWAELSLGEEEEEDVEEEEQGDAGAGEAKGAAAAGGSKGGAAAGPASAAAPAAAALPDLEGPAADGLARPAPGATVYATDKEVKEEVEKICAELRNSKDYVEAIRRLREEVGCIPGRLVRSRVMAAETIPLFALDSPGMADRIVLGKLLALLVPAKLVSRPMLSMAVARVCARLDVSVWASDYPKAKEWLVDILSHGAVVGQRLFHPAEAQGAAGMAGKAGGASSAIPPHDAQAVREGGYVPLSHVHPKVGALMRFNGVTSSDMKDMGKDLAPFATTLRKELDPDYEEAEAEAAAIAAAAAAAKSQAAAAGGASSGVPAVAKSPVSGPTSAPAGLAALSLEEKEKASAAAKASGLDDDGPSIVMGKKKKKKAKAKGAEEDEEDIDAI